MSLVDLAYTKAELKEEKAEMATGPGGQPNPYPWGVCLSLEKAELDKLGITELPGIGDEFHMTIIAKVTSVNSSAREGSDEESRVGLQITMAEVTAHESAAEEKAEGKETPASEAKESKSVMQKY
jgi:hypothetical protein